MAKLKVTFLYENPILNQLKNLEPGTEVNIETSEDIFYEATLEEYNEEAKEATLQIDRFYPEGGKDVTISSNDIVSIDTPDSKSIVDEDE